MHSVFLEGKEKSKGRDFKVGGIIELNFSRKFGNLQIILALRRMKASLNNLCDQKVFSGPLSLSILKYISEKRKNKNKPPSTMHFDCIDNIIDIWAMHLAEVKQGQLQGGNGLPGALEQLKARSPPPSPPLTPSQGRHPGKVPPTYGMRQLSKLFPACSTTGR